MKEKLLIVSFLFFISGTLLFAQTGNLSGKVVDEDNNALIGANVIITGSNVGAATNEDGIFTIKGIPAGKVNVVVSMIGYQKYQTSVDILANKTVELEVTLKGTTVKLSEVVVAGNIAKDRETPVAFTDVTEDQIKKNFTVQDIPHLFANTPGVYVTSDGGSGLGDSKVSIRGFDEQRIAVMINNVPVNDPESKKVYWSNWGSLPSASQSIQVQRGVGSSLYGSGALGGSINVVTKDAPARKSLGLVTSLGQYGIMKYGIDYNTGLVNNKFAFISRINYTQGNGWRDDTFDRGIQYYLSAMYFPDEKNTFKVILHGAPQYHAYSYYGFPVADYMKYGRKWNGHPFIPEGQIEGTAYANRGTKMMDVILNRIQIGANFSSQKGGLVIGNGNASFDNNVYHKPQFEIHHNYKFSDETKLTSTFFVSNGYGYGENLDRYYMVPRDAQGLMSWDGIYHNTKTKAYHYRNYSDHFQTGILSSFSTRLMGAHDLTFGIEGRWWKARHAGEILNTFERGYVDYYIGAVKQTFKDDNLYYDYTTTKPQLTGFAHALWRFDKLTIMTDIQFSFMKYHIVESIPSSNNYPNDPINHGGGTWTGTAKDADGNLIKYRLWDFEKSYSYVSPKFGANYNLTDNINVFANWSSAVNEPRVKYFFAYGSPNDALNLERTSDIELGAGYRGDLGPVFVDFKYNFYNIAFKGKALQIQDPTKSNTPGYDYKGRRYIPIGESTYRGHELALNLDMPYNFKLGFNASFADNLWGEPTDSEGAQYLYSKDNVVAGVDYQDANDNGKWDTGEKALHTNFVEKFGHKIEVGMPQTILGATLAYTSGEFYVNAALRHYADLYVLENNAKIVVEVDKSLNPVKESATLPSATIVDMVVGYGFKISSFPINVSMHVNNLLDEEYWQTGNTYGVLPGAARTIIFNASIALF